MTTIKISSLAASHLDEARRILDEDWDGSPQDMPRDVPIIVSSAGYILDGFHRVAAALGRGDRMILAVVATEAEKAAYVGDGEDGADEWIETVLDAHRE